jgi:hypothetical protein
MMLLPHRQHTYGPPRACYGDSSTRLYVMMFVPHRKHTYGAARPVTGIALRVFLDCVRTSQETYLWTSTACYGDSFTCLYVDDVRTSQETHLRY